MTAPPTLKHTFHAIIPHPDPARLSILLCPDPQGGGWVLPGFFEPEDGFFAEVRPLNKWLRVELGIDVVTLRCHKYEADHEVKMTVDCYFSMENRSPDWTPPEPMRWASREELADLPLANEEQRPIIEDWFAEAASGATPLRRVPWARPGWYDAATEWVRGHLAERSVTLVGPPEQVKQWTISCILRFPTDAGNYYLKTSYSYFAHEPAITRALATLYPGQVPEPLAILLEPEQGWMLMPDFGGDGDGLIDPTPAQLEEMMRMYARMQIGCIERVDDLLALGFMDRRLDVLSTQIDPLLADTESLSELTGEELEKLRADAPRLKAMCVRLESYGLPQTLSHGDFHDGNVIAKDGSYLIFDWTDACIAHPFLDLAVIIGPYNSGNMTPEERDHLLDSYLEQWTPYASIEQLREAANLARLLGALHQAVSYQHIVESMEAVARWEFKNSAANWLRNLLEK